MELDAMTSAEAMEPLSVRLWRRYGTQALELLEDIRQDRARRKCSSRHGIPAW